MGGSPVITIRFFRGRLGDLYHCDGDCVPLPECLMCVVPRDAVFGVLEIYGPDASVLTVLNGRPALRCMDLPSRVCEQVYAHYRELGIDTELEV